MCENASKLTILLLNLRVRIYITLFPIIFPIPVATDAQPVRVKTNKQRCMLEVC